MRKWVQRAGKMVLPTLCFLLAWAFLNVLVNLNYPAQEPHRLALLLPSPEVAVLLTALCAAVWLRMPFHPAVYFPLTALLIFFRLFRIGDVLMPMYFNRAFNLYIDSKYVPDLMHLLYYTVSLEAFIGYIGLGVALFTAVVWGVWRSFKTIHYYLAVRRQRHVFVGLTSVLLGLSLFLHPGQTDERSGVFAKGFFHRVVEEFDFILHVHGYRTQNLNAIRLASTNADQAPTSLDKLRGANVYVFFVESYGHTVFTDPRHFSMIAPVFESFEQGLEAHGFAVYSNFLTSPTYGGTSWLAHGTLASGVKLPNQMRYNLLVTSKVKTIAHYFNKAGYRTVSAMPGTTWPWPEGAFFGYQKKYYAWHFDYKGPSYGWSPMPDQYVLDYVNRQEIQQRTKPLFIEFVLVSSHAPFHRQPPYLEDWSQVGDGSIFHEKEIITFPIVWPDLSNAAEAYITSIIYEVKVLKAHLEQHIKDDALIIILGDHQPNVQITGENRPWSVPIHIISRNRYFLEPFAARGYTPGIIPRQPLPHPGMETFLYNLIEDFSKAPAKEITQQYAQGF
ncbi:MAG: sulfatase-like hydrolase/transferase [Syntrophobacteria bacterium]